MEANGVWVSCCCCCYCIYFHWKLIFIVFLNGVIDDRDKRKKKEEIIEPHVRFKTKRKNQRFDPLIFQRTISILRMPNVRWKINPLQPDGWSAKLWNNMSYILTTQKSHKKAISRFHTYIRGYWLRRCIKWIIHNWIFTHQYQCFSCSSYRLADASAVLSAIREFRSRSIKWWMWVHRKYVTNRFICWSGWFLFYLGEKKII